ncbi:MAG: ADP-glyceromanno-heptose 6-epimerase [Verrucomicrobiota bacterium]
MKSILVTGGAGFIGSNLTLELQKRYPDAWITVLDDFRCSNYKNLEGFKGDVVAKDMSRLDWNYQFGNEHWDAVFHIASITDTTEHNQRIQIEDNVESFRRLLNFVSPHKTPVVYATSAATYGITNGINKEIDPQKPANVYAFSKVQLENLAQHYVANNLASKIVGLRYFNVYGPREEHKGVPASMILHLAKQMKSGQRPRIFKHGEQKRDFVYVKDIVNYTIGALDAEGSAVYNAGSGEARSFNELITILNDVLSTNLEPEYIDNPHKHYQPHTEADMSKIKDELSLTPQFSLEDGVKDYFESGLLV